MPEYKFKIKPLDVVLAGVYVLLAPLAHYGLPFPFSAGAEILLLVAVGAVVFLLHRKEYEERNKQVDRGLLSPTRRDPHDGVRPSR